VAVDPKLELYLALQVEKAVRDAAVVATVVQTGGWHAAISETLEEWVSVAVLSISRQKTRRGVWRGDAMVQVSCFSRTAERRADMKTHRAWEIAAAVRVALEGVDLSVTELGAGGVYLGTVTFGEASMRGLSEPVASGITGVAVTFTGHLAAR